MRKLTLAIFLLIAVSALAAETKNLPPGFSIEYNSVRNLYRLCKKEAFGTGVDGCWRLMTGTKQQMINRAWEMLQRDKENAEEHWKPVK